MEVVKLNNGVSIPWLGLGTWQMSEGAETEAAVVEALKMGYRLIDTAAVYGNETSVGRAIKASGLPREQIFVTTKLWNSDQGSGAAAAFHKSLRRLGLDYVDLYLIHWPAPAGDRFLESWRVLEELYAQKLIRAIGVSNFKQSHLEKLAAHNSVVPALNQIEIHPHFQQSDLAAYCVSKGIQVESYSPLGGHGGSVIGEKVIQKIATKYRKTSAQIIIRWHIQSGYVVIPKASQKVHMLANIEVFDFKLEASDMTAISTLEAGRRRGPDPDSFNSGIKTGLVQLAHKLNLVHWRKEK